MQTKFSFHFVENIANIKTLVYSLAEQSTELRFTPISVW